LAHLLSTQIIPLLLNFVKRLDLTKIKREVEKLVKNFRGPLAKLMGGYGGGGL